LLRNAAWAKNLAIFAAGMLAYTTIVSPGYFAQVGQWLLVGMFAILLVLDLVSVSILMRNNASIPGTHPNVVSKQHTLSEKLD
jgi:hypothetical protein